MSYRPPKYLRQLEKNRPVDRAYTFVKGKKVGLGPYGSPENLAKFQAILDGSSSMQVNDGNAGSDSDQHHEPTITELMAAYLEHAERYYRRHNGTPGREYELIVHVCRYLRRQAGSKPAKDYRPRMLKSVRQKMVDAGLSRKYINKQIDRVRRMFRWAAGEEMIPSNVPQALSMVTGLRKGRSDARETEPVRPVNPETISATVTKLPQVVADMVQVQLFTGMRPGELIIMRPQDIDRSGHVWLYTPPHHKTDYRGHNRVIAIGPRAQEILLRYLARAAYAPMFQPRDSEAKRRAELTCNRKTPLSCGNRPGTNRKAKPKRHPGDMYTVDSYRRSIHRAAKLAGVEQWSPHRLRHTAATEVRRLFGLDSCQAVLGHRGAKVTEIYCEI